MKGICSICGEEKNHVHRSRQQGSLGKRRPSPLVCSTCRNKRTTPRKSCPNNQCGKMRPVAKYLGPDKTQPICHQCYSLVRYHNISTHETCSGCGQLAHVNARTAGNLPLCTKCRKDQRKNEKKNP